ncbi:MFS transporter [Patescibacteria group bacterium]|nr:MAG: MFS transporter [Patescibacteria group bacterium]
MKYLASNAIHIGNFLRAIGVYLPYIVYSTFLATFVPESAVGLIFAAGSILAGLAILSAPHLFRQFRTHRVLIFSASLAAFALLGLSLKLHAILIIALFFTAWVSGWVVQLALDVILEKILDSNEDATGSARAIFLTASSVAVAISSLIVAVSLTNGDYWRVFIIGAGAFLACAYISFRFFSGITHVEQTNVKVKDAFTYILKDKSLTAVMSSAFLLQLIFVWSSIYIPLYLHNHAQLEWSSIGLILALAMAPYILFQVPIGYLADKKYGEKEFIIGGFLISAISFLGMAFSVNAGIILLALLVIGLHMGGALLEIATETYFFKKVQAKDSELIGVFRALRQVATIAGPVLGSIMLFYTPFEYAFGVFGLVTLIGIPIAMSIVDTK